MRPRDEDLRAGPALGRSPGSFRAWAGMLLAPRPNKTIRRRCLEARTPQNSLWTGSSRPWLDERIAEVVSPVSGFCDFRDSPAARSSKSGSAESGRLDQGLALYLHTAFAVFYFRKLSSCPACLHPTFACHHSSCSGGYEGQWADLLARIYRSTVVIPALPRTRFSSTSSISSRLPRPKSPEHARSIFNRTDWHTLNTAFMA